MTLPCFVFVIVCVFFVATALFRGGTIVNRLFAQRAFFAGLVIPLARTRCKLGRPFMSVCLFICVKEAVEEV